MDAAQRVEQIISPAAEDLGFEIVRVQLSGDKRPRLQVMAEPNDGSNMEVGDCATLSRAISAVLDVEDPIPAEYTLEVSSPGIDRPLTRAKDFDRWKGFEARVEMNQMISGRKRFTGKLLGLGENDVIRIEVDGETHDLPFDDLYRAKLLLTDELIQAATREQSA
ncbi:MAG: ribosome maturation factor RimP [Rhodospirillaceae bacterium]|nr:ribosome maturation factor RimP [Rhodospirillaceae bacterium]